MSYTKTTWVNNTTPINDTNLNKIEQGIYDNSLVVDAVTDTLNPTDTETYKTAELTEGQITDVIAVNDIVIKGQTEQDGTPTPSAPVDVNIVSGSNVINTSSKNLFDKNTKDFSKGYFLNNNGVEQAGENWGVYYIRVEPNEVYSISGCQTNGGVSFCWFNKNKTFISYIGNKQNRNNMTAPNNAYYLGLSVVWNITSSAYDNNIMLEQNSTATTYEPHQGKELPLDLPVENLLNISNDINTTTSGITVSLINTDTIDFNGVASNTYISTGTVNLTKPLESGKTYYFKAFGNNDSNLRFRIWGYNSNNELKFNVADGNSLTLNTDIVKYKLVLEWLITNNKYNVQAKFQVSEAPYINTYTPYGTEPIELCKIGDYQDYFYKSGSKWYLHKEVGKVVLDGSESDFSTVGSSGSYYRISLLNVNNIKNFGSQRTTNIFINNFSKSTVDNYNSVFQYEDDIYFYLPEGMSTKQAFVDLLSSTNSVLYYVLNNTTDTEITDTTLISQLEAIYNAPLYEQTNITQENNDLPMVLDITACKDNINGIKAFIRK